MNQRLSASALCPKSPELCFIEAEIDLEDFQMESRIFKYIPAGLAVF